MFDPFVRLSNLTPEQLRQRARAIQARLHDWSADELLRGRRDGEPSDLGVRGPPRHGYDPNQPRVPAGHPDGGQWTDDERWADHPLIGARFAAARELPPLHPRRIVIYLARRLIEAIRRELASWDLFGEVDQKKVTVAVTTIDGRDIHGTSSTSGDWQPVDYAEARRLRAIIARRYPHQAEGRPLGQYPLDSLFHAETNVLLRAARESGGSLAGRTLEVFVDGNTCNNCRRILGHVARELGNPTVKFTNSKTGRVMGVVRDGQWRPQ